MSQYAFYVNTDKCVSCRSCVIACKDKNELKPGRKFRKVHAGSSGSWDIQANGACRPVNIFSYSLSVACNHCATPACRDVCPSGAIAKRDDGIVFIDKTLCTGCKNCATACPYNAPSFNNEILKMEKCDFCRELLAAGEAPACVAACNMLCIEYGDIEQLMIMHPEAVRQVAPLPDPAQTTPSLLITPHRWSSAGMTVTQYNLPEEIQASEA